MYIFPGIFIEDRTFLPKLVSRNGVLLDLDPRGTGFGTAPQEHPLPLAPGKPVHAALSGSIPLSPAGEQRFVDLALDTVEPVRP